MSLERYNRLRSKWARYSRTYGIRVPGDVSQRLASLVIRAGRYSKATRAPLRFWLEEVLPNVLTPVFPHFYLPEVVDRQVPPQMEVVIDMSELDLGILGGPREDVILDYRMGGYTSTIRQMEPSPPCNYVLNPIQKQLPLVITYRLELGDAPEGGYMSVAQIRQQIDSPDLTPEEREKFKRILGLK